MPSLLQLNSISTQVEHGLQVPTVTHSPTAFNIWEYLSLFILPSAAAVVYAILHIKLPTVTQVVIPFAMFILIGMILLRTPREYYTTIFLTLQLAGITILATSDNSYSTSSRESTFTYTSPIIDVRSHRLSHLHWLNHCLLWILALHCPRLSLNQGVSKPSPLLAYQ